MAPLACSLGATQPCGHPGGVRSGDGGLNAVADKIDGKVLEATNVLAEAFAITKGLLVQAKQHTARRDVRAARCAGQRAQLPIHVFKKLRALATCACVAADVMVYFDMNDRRRF